VKVPEKPSDLLSLRGRTAILTGGGRGLGRTMAQGLAAAGARLVIAGRDESVLSKASHELNADGGTVTWESVDLDDRAATIEFARRVLSKYGRVDVLVHNAGQEGLQPVDQVTEKTMDAVFATNFFSAVQMTRAFVPGMKQNGWGRLVYISSATTRVSGTEGHSVYTASKCALEGYARTVAVELGRSGITANCLSPGTYLTDQAKGVLSSLGEVNGKVAYDAFSRMTAVGRWGNPEDLIAPLLLLTSDASRFLTGEVLRVDGGLSIKLRPS
jgi:NAD(P)-dependent dehydrogenase (short-subunit alcohol dehydrogenase family)